MPFNYVTVKASSDLFTPATRAFGDILVIGKGALGSTGSGAKSFTYPSEAVRAYPQDDEAGRQGRTPVSTVSAAAKFPVGTEVAIGKEEEAEVRTIKTVAEAAAGKFTLTLDKELKSAHAVDDPVVGLDLSELAAAISLAFRQTPPPTKVWGIEVAFSNPVWSTALTAAEDVPAQIVVLANTPLNEQPSSKHPVELLAKHVTEVSNTGGDGKERIGVAMLDRTLTQVKQIALNKGAIHDNRMVLVAHKSAKDDVAAAVAGVIAGHEPHISLLLKSVSLEMPELFTATEIETYYNNSINWVTSPVMLPGHGLYLGEGLTASPSGNKKYIDIVRTLDDISFRIKAALIEAVGDLRIDRPGLRTVVTLVQSVLSPLVTRGVIEDYTIHIPLLVLLERERATLNADELEQIGDGRSGRSVDMEVSVVYAGVIHQIAVKLVLKG